jgi:hypothetical protein
MRMSRFQSFERSTSARSTTCSLFEFYREEFLKHQRCIHAQRECFSERAICDVEAALTRILTELDRLCAQQDGAQVVSRLLQKIDTLTGLSAMSDPKQVH